MSLSTGVAGSDDTNEDERFLLERVEARWQEVRRLIQTPRLTNPLWTPLCEALAGLSEDIALCLRVRAMRYRLEDLRAADPTRDPFAGKAET